MSQSSQNIVAVPETCNQYKKQYYIAAIKHMVGNRCRVAPNEVHSIIFTYFLGMDGTQFYQSCKNYKSKAAASIGNRPNMPLHSVREIAAFMYDLRMYNYEKKKYAPVTKEGTVVWPDVYHHHRLMLAAHYGFDTRFANNHPINAVALKIKKDRQAQIEKERNYGRKLREQNQKDLAEYRRNFKNFNKRF